MKVKIYSSIFFLLIFTDSAVAQSNNIVLSIEKEFYSSKEDLSFTITQSSGPCTGVINTAYLELLNSKLQTIQHQIVQLKRAKTTFHLSLLGMDTGYYLVRAYTKESRPENTQSIAIGIDIPVQEQSKEEQLTASLYPEGGNVLVNFTNRFAVSLCTQTGRPVQDHLLIRNNQNQVIAVCSTGNNGWAAVDIPTLRNDVITIYTNKGKLLHTINTKNDEIVKDVGFCLHIEQQGEQIIAEMRKAEGELSRKASFQVFYKDILLYESAGVFREDTTIVATSFSTKGLENKLLRLVLKDGNDIVASERLALLPAVKNEADALTVEAEISCGIDGMMPFYIENYLPQTIFDNLIAMKGKKQPVSIPKVAEGFSLRFQNKALSGQTVNYTITDTIGNLIQVGKVLSDSTGLFAIEGCLFKRQARILFYNEGKQIAGFTPVHTYYMEEKEGRIALNKLEALIQKTDTKVLKSGLFELPALSKPVSISAEKELQGVTVVGVKKSRIEELEEKYVNSGMFKDMNSISISVEDDANAITYTLIQYLIKEIPGLMVRKENIGGVSKEGLIYRRGYVDFFIDETPLTDINILPNVFLGDIGYIKFFRNPVNGGMAAQRGGAMLRGSSFAAGLQGSVAIYTKKYVGAKETGIQSKGLNVNGYVNE